MGGQAASSKSKVENDLVTKAFNSCPNVVASNTVNLSGVQFRPDLNPQCVNPKFEINQSAGVEADCVIKSLQDSLAETVSKMSAESQGGFGFQASQTVSDIKTQIEQITENNCGNQSATNVADIKDTLVTACDWHFVQNATAKSSCKLDSLQKLTNEVTSEQAATSTGLTLASFFTGYGGLTTIIMIIIIGGGLYGGYSYYQENESGKTQSGGGMSMTSRIIILLTVVFIVNRLCKRT